MLRERRVEELAHEVHARQLHVGGHRVGDLLATSRPPELEVSRRSSMVWEGKIPRTGVAGVEMSVPMFFPVERRFGITGGETCVRGWLLFSSPTRPPAPPASPPPRPRPRHPSPARCHQPSPGRGGGDDAGTQRGRLELGIVAGSMCVGYLFEHVIFLGCFLR